MLEGFGWPLWENDSYYKASLKRNACGPHSLFCENACHRRSPKKYVVSTNPSYPSENKSMQSILVLFISLIARSITLECIGSISGHFEP